MHEGEEEEEEEEDDDDREKAGRTDGRTAEASVAVGHHLGIGGGGGSKWRG